MVGALAQTYSFQSLTSNGVTAFAEVERFVSGWLSCETERVANVMRKAMDMMTEKIDKVPGETLGLALNRSTYVLGAALVTTRIRL